jgi:hypothetical protein
MIIKLITAKQWATCTFMLDLAPGEVMPDEVTWNNRTFKKGGQLKDQWYYVENFAPASVGP